jgi:hypothetical protein
MRIAQINNNAGAGSILAEQQRKDGHEVEVFVLNKITHKQFGGRKFNYCSPFDIFRISTGDLSVENLTDALIFLIGWIVCAYEWPFRLSHYF